MNLIAGIIVKLLQLVSGAACVFGVFWVWELQQRNLEARIGPSPLFPGMSLIQEGQIIVGATLFMFLQCSICAAIIDTARNTAKIVAKLDELINKTK